MFTTTTPHELDQLIVTAQAGIAELLARGATDDANRKSYNLAADLAECWPGDERPRELRHLEAGREAAERCLAWRMELGKGPGPFAIAHWVHGMHLLSLARRAGSAELTARAVAAFEQSVESALQAAREKGASEEVGADGDYLVILNSGFLGLARAYAANPGGRAQLDRSRAAFRAQAEQHPERREDALYGLENLEVVARQFLAAC